MPGEIVFLREDLQRLRAEVISLAAKARKADDYTEICNLQAACGYFVGKGRWDYAAGLFALNGTLELAGRGVYVGRERVRRRAGVRQPARLSISVRTADGASQCHMDT